MPTPPSQSERPVSSDATDTPSPHARLQELTQELEAREPRADKAVLTYEIGHLYETALGQAGQALQHYLQSYNLDHDFRLSLYALLRLFEPRGSNKNLPRLYQAQLKSTRNPQEKAAALIDEALWLLQSEGDMAAARAQLNAGLEESEGSLPLALLSEALHHLSGNAPGAGSAVVAQGERSDDPVRRALALCEAAAWHEAQGDIPRARESVARAVESAPQHEFTHVAACRLLARHGPLDQRVDALTRYARSLDDWRDAEPDLDPDDRSRVGQEVAALWCEAARLNAGPLSAPTDALACLKEAAELLPEDHWIRQLRMLAYDLLEDRHAAAAEARALLEAGVRGTTAAGLHFRIAELALTEGNTLAARDSLLKAIEAAGGDSPATAAMLDDLLLDAGRHGERVDLLMRPGPDGTVDSLHALHAGTIAAGTLSDAALAKQCFAHAKREENTREAAAREAYWTAVTLGDDSSCREALDDLLELTMEADERAALMHHRLTLSEANDGSVSEKVAAYLTDPSCAWWLPHVARVTAAAVGNWDLLARAHRVLAEGSENPELAAAHWGASARSLLRTGDWKAAVEALRAALELSPSEPYALTLLQEALRAGGQQAEVVELLVGAAERQKSVADAALSLLLAGAAAEGAGDPERAAQMYEEAADRDPSAVGPLWALLRLAERSGDQDLELRAREGLSQRERAQGPAGHETLLLAEHYDAVHAQPLLAAPELDQLLQGETARVAPYAAVDLALLREVEPPQRIDALRYLEKYDPEGRALWLRELGGLLEGTSEEAAAEGDVDALLALRGEDAWALWRSVERQASGKIGPVAAAALERLAAATRDESLAQALSAEALRARRWDDAETLLDADLEAAGFGAGAAWSPAAGRIVLEQCAPGTEPAARAKAYAAQMEAFSGPDRGSMLRGLAQARLEAGDASAATALLGTQVEDDPDDLAAWELLRVAARRAGRWGLVAQACDTLAQKLEGELWAQLSEECAAVRMDCLGEDEAAERTLRAVLAYGPARPNAFARLHDLLTERDDTEGLLELVTARISVTDEAEDLIKLFYEQARLHRASSDLDGALGSLENLLMLDGEHVAGLALAAEIHTAKEDWQGAVDALRELARTDIPLAQRKLARLGAADYLEHKLQDPEGALEELTVIETEGLAGASVYVRMAKLYERGGKIAQCVKALHKAAEETTGSERAEHLRHAGELLQKNDDRNRARPLFQQVLEILPTDWKAAEALARATENLLEREKLLVKFEQSVREEVRQDPISAQGYRKLRNSARLRGDGDLQLRATSALSVLNATQAGEEEWLDNQVSQTTRSLPEVQLTETDLESLLQPKLDGRYEALAQPLWRALAELEHFEPSQLGVGRADRIGPRDEHKLRDEVRGMLNTLGGELADFYVGGSSPSLVVAMPKGLATHFVVGVGVTTPLNAARRHEIALHVAAARLGCLPLLHRSTAQAASLLHAAVVGAEQPLAPSIDRTAFGDMPRLLWKAAARRDRKAMVEAAQGLDDGGAGAVAYCEGLRMRVHRIALLLSDDLGTALTQALNGPPDEERIAGSTAARDLMCTWLSRELATLRRKLGIAL